MVPFSQELYLDNLKNHPHYVYTRRVLYVTKEATKNLLVACLYLKMAVARTTGGVEDDLFRPYRTHCLGYPIERAAQLCTVDGLGSASASSTKPYADSIIHQEIHAFSTAFVSSSYLKTCNNSIWV